MSNLLKVGLAVAGSTLVAKGAQAALDAYAPQGVRNFLDSFGLTTKDVGEGVGTVASTFFGGTASDPLDMSDMPSVSPISPVSTAAARIAAPGAVAVTPLGNNNRVAELAQRANVQAKIVPIATVGIPAPRVVPANISIGKAVPKKVKIRGTAKT
jgi:hypothetical protein|tara:strand:- start:126 stop:590 length:465 start_codon:yes stop_codon:yes gene_type:complete